MLQSAVLTFSRFRLKKRGGGDLARHIFFGLFYMKSHLCQGGLLDLDPILAKKGGGDLTRHFDLQPISAKKRWGGGT